MILRAWLTPLLLAPVLAVAQFPFLRSLEVSIGQRHPQISRIVQDSLGLFWTGSDLGLLRTDGERVDRLSGAEYGSVSAMLADGGAVLVAYSQGTVLRYVPDGCDTLFADSSLASTPVRAMVRTSDGALWLGTYGAGLWRIPAGPNSQPTIFADLPDAHVNDLAVLDKDRVVVATDQGLAIAAAHGVQQVFDEAKGAPDNLVMAVAVLPNGQVVAGTDAKGVFRWDPHTHSASQVGAPWRFGPVSRIEADNGRIWVGTRTEGVVVIGSGTDPGFHQRATAGGIITDLWLDRTGAIWWCDGSEHLRRADPAILVVPEKQGIDLRKVSAICVDRRNRVWVATPQGIHHHAAGFSAGDVFEPVMVELDPSTPVVSLAATSSGTIWAATFGSGVFSMAPDGTVKWFSTADGLRDRNVLAAHAEGDSVWFATLNGVSLWDGHAFSEVCGAAGFIFDVLPTGQSNALFATDGQGVLACGPARLDHVPVLPRTFYSLAKDNAGRVWAIGPKTGLCMVAGGPTNCVDADLPVFADDLYAVATLRNHVLVFGQAGTMAFDPVSGAWTDISGRIGTTGVQAELNAVAYTADGDLWYACDRGLIRLHLNDAHLNPHIPVVITGVSIAGDRRPPTTEIHTTADRNDVTIHFTSLYYEDPSVLRFEYQVGADGQLLHTRDRELALAGLAPGTHRVRIRAFIGADQSAAEPCTIVIHVALPWWRKPWVIAMALLCLVMVVVVVVRIRERRMRDQERMAQEKVRFQLEALRSQVDPHFLFNSFNTLVALIETDPDKAVDHVEALSTFFRSMLLVRDKELIPLAEELELLKGYFDLEHRRFGRAITLTIHAERLSQNQTIVPLTLQMLVENALKHNVATVQDPLVVAVQVEADEVVVRNDLRPRSAPAHSTGFGLQSIIQRYTAFGPRAVVVERHGGRFVVRIPILQHNEDSDR